MRYTKPGREHRIASRPGKRAIASPTRRKKCVGCARKEKEGRVPDKLRAQQGDFRVDGNTEKDQGRGGRTVSRHHPSCLRESNT